MTAEGVPIVLPSYPQLKLWEESTTLLNIGTQNLRRARPQDNKYALPIQDQFCRTPLPLSEIIELHRPFIHYQSSHGIQKLSFLRKNTYRYRFIKLMNMETQYRQEMLRIANHIHMKTQVPKD